MTEQLFSELMRTRQWFELRLKLDQEMLTTPGPETSHPQLANANGDVSLVPSFEEEYRALQRNLNRQKKLLSLIRKNILKSG